MAKTLFDKIWDLHVIREIVPGAYLLHVDRNIVHDLGGPHAFAKLDESKRGVHNPELNLAVADHTVASSLGRDESTGEIAPRYVREFREQAARHGLTYLGPNDPRQGIVHVVGPELGFTLPGMVLVCGDSHTGTNGGMGTLAWGIGTTELVSVLVSQAIIVSRPKRMRVNFEGARASGVSAKDCVLYMIGRLGADGGDEHAVEYAGAAIQAMTIEERLTICNMSIEFGARMGTVAPDDVTYQYLHGRALAPKGALWDRAVAHWRTLPTDDGAAFDKEHTLDAAVIGPQVTWGNSPQDVIAIGDPIPTPDAFASPARRRSAEEAYAYMGLTPGASLEGLPVDYAFIGSCTNARLSDLREAAAAIRGGRVPEGVTAWVVPGSQQVKRDAEAEGLDRAFLAAGFEWREPGCAMCASANGEVVPPGKRSISTTNRNFVGRQGPRSRTHLASPAMVAAAAVAGHITDVRKQGGALMEPFRTLTGIAASLPGRDINTDMIMPTDIIIRTTPEKMGGFALYPLRFRPDGSENPDFVLNQPPFRGAPILITGENFGCGSSREFAASGLYLYGIRALIGASFGPIFYANCFQNGLLPIILPPETIAALARQAGGLFTIDLEACRVIPPEGAPIPFAIEPLKREQLLTGLDAVGLASREIGAIEAFQADDRERRPWIYLA